jgi:NAD(P)-dependent dehydrogenase (short-subunit alcohol dehydrogenase family)
MVNKKTIVITGAASGIGRAWAKAFNQEGANVIACDINQEDLFTLEELGISTSVTDVSDDQQVKDLINFAIEKTGRLDVVFNNAGMGYGHKLEESPVGAFEHHVAVHLFGCVYGMKYAIPQMRKQGSGRIVNTISRNAETNTYGTSAYSAAKAAIWSATRVVAYEVSDTDILINMIIPGPTNTGIWGKDMKNLQSPEVTYPTARMLATLKEGGPNAKVFWDEKEYPMFNSENEILKK